VYIARWSYSGRCRGMSLCVRGCWAISRQNMVSWTRLSLVCVAKVVEGGPHRDGMPRLGVEAGFRETVKEKSNGFWHVP
jgi:hypothetical protein